MFATAPAHLNVIPHRPIPRADSPTFTAKSRTIMVRLISMAMTGYYRTMQRPRAHHPLSMLKYDPIGTTLLQIVSASRVFGLNNWEDLVTVDLEYFKL